MKVEFYGHVRQYHSIQAEIDTNLKTVLESGQYLEFDGEGLAVHYDRTGAGLARVRPIGPVPMLAETNGFSFRCESLAGSVPRTRITVITHDRELLEW